MFKRRDTGRSVFKSEAALSATAVPDALVGREAEVKAIANAVEPVARNGPPDNLLVYGPSGVGKTACVMQVFDKLEEQTNTKTVHLNCWNQGTKVGLFTQLLIELGYPTPRKGRASNALLSKIREWLDKNRSVVLALDEFDQLQNAAEIVYNLHHVSQQAENELGLVLIANEPDAEQALDARVRSRLGCRLIRFDHYDAGDLTEILEQRAEQAFRPDAVSDQVIALIADMVAEEDGDCREAFNMLLSAGRQADRERADTVTAEHLQQQSAAPEQASAPT